MSDAELKAAIARVEDIRREIDSPDAERGQREDAIALGVLLDAADIVLSVRRAVA